MVLASIKRGDVKKVGGIAFVKKVITLGSVFATKLARSFNFCNPSPLNIYVKNELFVLDVISITSTPY